MILQRHTKYILQNFINVKNNTKHSTLPFLNIHRNYVNDSLPSSSPIEMSFAKYGNVDPAVTPIIVMHGLYGSKQNWKSSAKAIVTKTNPKRQVIAIDARNHGDSPHSPNHSYIDLADDVALFHQQHNIPKSIVMGHSMGGRCMMIFALRYPELVEKLIVVDIAPKTTTLATNQVERLGEVIMSMAKMQIPKELSIAKGRQKAGEQLKKGFPDKVTRDFILMNLYKKEDESFGWRMNIDAIYNNFATHIKDFPNENNAQYNGPTLFLAGTESDFINPKEFPEYQKIFPNSRLEMVQCGHLIHLEKPKEFLQLVTNFVNN